MGHIAVLLDSLLGKPRGFSDWAEGLIDEWERALLLGSSRVLWKEGQGPLS